MARKLKFKPEITRVKLNPEQAVLNCNCHGTGWRLSFVRDGGAFRAVFCCGEGKTAYGNVSWMQDGPSANNVVGIRRNGTGAS